MAFYNKVYLADVETINQDIDRNSLIDEKVIALKINGINKITKTPNYKPIRTYGEYYKLVSISNKPLVGPFGNLVDDKTIDKAIKKTGKKEVKQLTKQ